MESQSNIPVIDQSCRPPKPPDDAAEVSANLPLAVIESRSGWGAIDFRELWAYRGLLYFLTWRDVKVRYKQTALGASWAILQPLFTMLIFTIFFGRLAGVPSEGIPYPLFAYAGILPWTYFSTGILTSGSSLIGSANLITKVYFPRIMIPAAAVLAGLVDFAFALLILVGMLIYYRVSPTWSLALFPLLTLLLMLLEFAVGMWMAALNVRYRDIRYALPFAVQLWIFITPVIYPSTFVPARWRWLLQLNPMTGIIEGYRACLFSSAFDWKALGISAVLTFAMLTYASFAFRKMERGFADIV